MKTISLKDENGKIYYGWWIVIAAAIITGFVYSGIVSVTGVFVLPVTEGLGISIGGFSLYTTVMSVANILTLVIISKFFTKKHLKKIMVIAGIVGIISFLGFASAKSLWSFYIFAVPQGFCFAAMTMTPCQLLVSNWFGEKVKGRAIAFFLTGMMIGQVIELNLLNAVIMRLGWRAAYVSLAILIGVAVITVLGLVSWSPEEKGIKRMGDITAEEAEGMASAITRGADFKDIAKKPITWLMLISCTLTVIVSASIVSHAIPTMVMGGFKQEVATVIMSVVSLLVAVIGPAFGVLCDKVKLSIPVVGAAVCFGISALGLALISVSQTYVWVYSIFYLVGVGSINVLPPLIVNYMYGEKEMPRMLGYINIFIAIGGAVGTAGVGMLYEACGSYQIPWIIMAAIMGIVAVIRGAATTKKRKFNADETAA